jgi:hypothetical protein
VARRVTAATPQGTAGSPWPGGAVPRRLDAYGQEGVAGHPEQESAIAAALAANPGVPHGYVAFGINFDAQGAHLYSLAGKRGRAAKTRVAWDDAERVAQKIDAWALDLFAHWNAVEARWARLVAEWNAAAGF